VYPTTMRGDTGPCRDGEEDVVHVDDVLIQSNPPRSRPLARIVAVVGLLVIVAAGVAVAIVLTSTSATTLRLPRVRAAILHAWINFNKSCCASRARDSRRVGLAVFQSMSGDFATTDRFAPAMKYNGRFHKTIDPDGRSEVEGVVTHIDPENGLRIVVTVVDRRAYQQVFNDSYSSTMPVTAECYPSELVPPFGDLDLLASTASTVPVHALDPENSGLQACGGATTLWSVVWGTQEYVYCQPDADAHVVRRAAAHTADPCNCVHACSYTWA